MNFRIIDHTDDVIRATNEQIQAALEATGNQAVSHAKSILTSGIPRNAESWYTPTGTLRNSVTHQVSEKTVYVGTNNEYAIYNEYGTGIYCDGGRRTPWMYKDDRGVWHKTRGMKALHFLRNALADHLDEYREIIKRYLHN